MQLWLNGVRVIVRKFQLTFRIGCVVGPLVLLSPLCRAADLQVPPLRTCFYLLAEAFGLENPKVQEFIADRQLLRVAGYNQQFFKTNGRGFEGAKLFISNIEAAVGVKIRPKDSDNTMRLGVELSSPNDSVVDPYEISYSPGVSAFFVPRATIELVDKVVNSKVSSDGFLPARWIIDPFLAMLDEEWQGIHFGSIISNRLSVLKKMPNINIAGLDYVGVGPTTFALERMSLVRLAKPADWVFPAPRTLENDHYTLSLKDFDGVAQGFGDGLPFEDIIFPERPDSFWASVPRGRGLQVEGVETCLVDHSGNRAACGIYRGIWRLGRLRGYPLYHEVVNQDQRKQLYRIDQGDEYHFLQIGNDGNREIIAVRSFPGIRLFSTAAGRLLQAQPYD